MNSIIIIGRLTRDPDVSTAASGTLLARYTLAVDRRGKNSETDFIPCVAFNRAAEFAQTWLHKGMKICVRGELQTGSYTDREGNKRNTFNVVVAEHEFCERANAPQSAAPQQQTAPPQTRSDAKSVVDGFLAMPDGIQEELPFE